MLIGIVKYKECQIHPLNQTVRAVIQNGWEETVHPDFLHDELTMQQWATGSHALLLCFHCSVKHWLSHTRTLCRRYRAVFWKTFLLFRCGYVRCPCPEISVLASSDISILLTLYFSVLASESRNPEGNMGFKEWYQCVWKLYLLERKYLIYSAFFDCINSM